MELAYLIMLGVGILASAYKIILYVRTQKNWWNPIAQVILVLSGALGAIFTWVLLVRLWPTIPGRNVIGFILFSVVVSATVWEAYTLQKLFKVVKRDKNVRFSQEDQSNT